MEVDSIETEEELRGHRADPLVSIDEGMIHDQRMPEGRRLVGDIGIEVLPAERHLGPGERGFQAALFAKAVRATGW